MIPPDAPMPDDLIRLNTWAELTDAEKALLNGIAGNEEEFRLLKLMLTTTGTQHEVPEVNTTLPTSLRTAFRQAEAAPVRKMGWWRYAAAAAVLLAIAGTVWLTRTKNNPELPVARKEQPAPVQNIENKTVPPLPEEEKRFTPPVIKTAPKKISPQKQAPVNPNNPLPPKKDKQVLPELQVTTTNTVAINTSLKDNSELLQLVTAVY